MDQWHHARSGRRRARDPAGLGLVGAQGQAAAGRPAHDRQAAGAVHQRALGRPRLLGVRDVPGPSAAAACAANSLNTLMRSLGMAFASALAGVILAQMTSDFGGHALPSENGFKVVMAIGAGAALRAFLVASFIPRRQPAAQAPKEAPEQV